MYESESKTMATYGSSLLSLLLSALEGNGIVELETSYKGSREKQEFYPTDEMPLSSTDARVEMQL